MVVQPWQASNGSLSYPERSNEGKGKWIQNTTDKVVLSEETLKEIVKCKSPYLHFVIGSPQNFSNNFMSSYHLSFLESFLNL